MTTSSGSSEERGDLRHQIVFRSLKYIFSRSVTGGLGALASLVLFRVLGPGEAGQFSLTLALSMTLGTIGGLGFHNALARFVPERGESGEGLYRAALIKILRVSAVAVVVLLLLAWRRILLPSEVIQVAPVFILATVAYSIYAASIGMFSGQGRLALVPRMDFGENFLAKAAALGVLLVLPGFPGAFSAHTAVQVGVTILALYLLRNTLRAPSVEFERTEIIFARTVLVGDIIRVLVNTINLYLIRAYMEPADVGIYAAGVRFTRMMEMLVLSPVAVPLLYYFSHPDSTHMKERIVRRGTRVVGAVMGLAALVLVILAEPVVRIFLGEAYAGSAEVARVYASHALGLGMLILVIPFYSSINKPHYTVLQGILTFVVNLGLALVLIPRYGPVGAAAAAVAAILVTVLAANVFLRLRFSIHGLGVVVRLFLLYGVSYALVEIGLPLVGVGLYAALLVPLGLIRRDDLDLLRRKRK